MCAGNTHLSLVQRISNNPSFSTEHTGDVRFEHVEGVVNSLLLDYNPSPTLGLLGQNLAEAVSRILVLEKNSARINELLCVLSQHTVNGRAIVHVWERVTVCHESITDLLQLGLNGGRLVEDDEDRLLNELPSLRISDRLLDGSKPNEAVTTRGTEDHTLKTSLFLRRHNASNGGEPHIKIEAALLPEQSLRPPITPTTIPGRTQLRNGQPWRIRHEELTGLLQNLLELHLFIVLNSEFLRVAVELLQLILIAFEFDLKGLKELSSSLVLAGGRAVDKGVNVAGWFEFEVELVALVGEEAEFALEFVAAFDVGYVTTLEWC
mmetsp:Transcript_18832/g.23721  ORF Transcript_18832/g.23721 Transcript_18832/m.23721 type:complete len:321 (-) Transcript_18832:174-1136(-)